MPKITKKKDVERSTQAKKEPRGGDGDVNFVKFEKGKTPFYICDEEYHEGYFHYVEDSDGQKRKVLCAGGIEAKGFAPDDCSICAVLAELRSLNDKGLKKLISDADASYGANFIVAAGELIAERRGSKKVMVPDFEDREVGVTSFSHAQFESLKDSADLADLVDRIIVVKREMTTGNFKYLDSTFLPSKKASDCPADPEEYEDIDLEEIYALDDDLAEELADHLMEVAGSSNKPKRSRKAPAKKKRRPEPEEEDDEDEEEEERPRKKKRPPVKKAAAKKKRRPPPEEEDDDDWEDDDDGNFEDDIPY